MSHLNEQEGYELFRHWNLYERVVRFNHMRHREITFALQQTLNQLPQPIRVLDLGSGAGELAFAGLKRIAVREYVGIDLSADAVEQLRAKESPGSLGDSAKVVGICGDMLESLHRLPDESFEVVLASYSLHHFKRLQKSAVLLEISRVLVPGGTFIWIDLVCNEGESLEAYLERSCERIRQEWNSLSPDEKEATCLHATTCDFPEQAEVMQQLIVALPFMRGRAIYRDELYGGWVYRKQG